MSTEEIIRMDCLRLAVGQSYHGADAVEIARRYADFVRGTRDAEIIDAARTLSRKINASD